MKREFRPEPDPSGALQPPNRRPPTAVGAATPEPEWEPMPASPVRARQRRMPSPALIMLRLLTAVPLLAFRLGRKAARQLIHR